jgi:hypothetical protein
MLETRGICDNLHKELERRENRNEVLMKELAYVRQLHKENQVSSEVDLSHSHFFFTGRAENFKINFR